MYSPRFIIFDVIVLLHARYRLCFIKLNILLSLLLLLLWNIGWTNVVAIPLLQDNDQYSLPVGQLQCYLMFNEVYRGTETAAS